MPTPLGIPDAMMGGGIDTGVTIANSCRFNDDDNANTGTSRAASVSRTTGTMSCWVKRGNLGVTASIYSGLVNASWATRLYFDPNDNLHAKNIAGSTTMERITTQVFRDPSAWYHIVWQLDTTNVTAADRVKLWVNGVEITSFSTSTDQPQNSDIYFARTATNPLLTRWGQWANTEYLDGYLAECHIIDGTAYDANSFGKFNTEGHWVPISPSVTYGSGGNYLDFKVAPGTGNGAGTDVSGNANHFTDSGLAANDQRTDTPTNNHCTFNPLQQSNRSTLQDGNLISNRSAGGQQFANWAMDRGKWYWEVAISTGTVGVPFIGVASPLANIAGVPGNDNYSWALNDTATNVLKKNHDSVNTTLISAGALSSGNYVMLAYDADTGSLWFGLNGTWLDSGDPAAGTGAQYTALDQSPIFPTVGQQGTTNTITALRTESGDFQGTVPTGFKALNTVNLSDTDDAPIPKGSDYFDVLTWGGDGTSPRSIVGLDFKPDLVWIKNRTLGSSHSLYDSTIGVAKRQLSDAAIADVSSDVNGYLSAFNSDGFTVTAGSTSDNLVNDAAYNFVAWCWKKAAVAGFDISTYTGTGVAKTVAHVLGAAPDVVVAKSRTSALDWYIYHSDTLTSVSIPITDPETDGIFWDLANALTDNVVYWNDTAPDASNFTVGTGATNASGATYSAYSWANVSGFSRQGSYVGNGNAGGPFVWCGFRPRLIWIKNTAAAVSWTLWDTGRQYYNDGANPRLIIDTTVIEDTLAIDFLSNGFKIRNNGGTDNTSGGEYLFMAFAEHPFKYARAF